MVDRLRALLDRPLEPSAARAIIVLASAILLGVAALFILAVSQPEQPTSPARGSSEAAAPVSTTAAEPPDSPRPAGLRQDPQDVKGSEAAKRAARALRSHRALQHVPYRNGELEISLVGARGGRAVLSVHADTMRAAREGWRRFLRRHRDSGRAYDPIFRADLRGGA